MSSEQVDYNIAELAKEAEKVSDSLSKYPEVEDMSLVPETESYLITFSEYASELSFVNEELGRLGYKLDLETDEYLKYSKKDRDGNELFRAWIYEYENGTCELYLSR